MYLFIYLLLLLLLFSVKSTLGFKVWEYPNLKVGTLTLKINFS